MPTIILIVADQAYAQKADGSIWATPASASPDFTNATPVASEDVGGMQRLLGARSALGKDALRICAGLGITPVYVDP